MYKLTTDRQNQLCARIAEGMNKSEASTAVGISRRTLNNWLKKGAAKQTERYTDFYNAYQLAEQVSYQNLCRQVLEDDVQIRTELDADGNVLKTVRTETRSWRQAAWLLEKRFPHLFREQIEKPSAPERTPQPPNYTALVALVKQFEAENKFEEENETQRET